MPNNAQREPKRYKTWWEKLSKADQQDLIATIKRELPRAMASKKEAAKKRVKH